MCEYVCTSVCVNVRYTVIIDIRGGNGLETALTSGLNPHFGHVMDSPCARASATNANTNISSRVVRSALDSVLENSLLKAVASEGSRRV